MRNFKALTLCLIMGCAAGPDGEAGSNCTVVDNGDGTATITCDDGTEATITSGQNGENGAAGEDGATGPKGLTGDSGEDGANGKDGRDCTVVQNEDGTATITCTDGTSTTIGVDVDTSGNTTGGNGGGCFGDASDLIISEYIEGGSNNKAIEIFNGTDAAISLNGYSLRIGRNGANWTTMNQLNGSLAAGEVFVVCNGSANAEIRAQCDLESGSVSYNGDDAVGLFKASTALDVIGQVGQDPGSEWDIEGGATKDHTLVRKAHITSGTDNWGIGAGQWTVYEKDTVYYLGTHGFDCDE